MSFLDDDAEDLEYLLQEFGEDILYNGAEIKAIVDYGLDNEDSSRGQKTIATIVIAAKDVLVPAREDYVILPNAGTYKVEKILSGDKNAWRCQIRTDVRGKVGK